MIGDVATAKLSKTLKKKKCIFIMVTVSNVQLINNTVLNCNAEAL